MPPKDSKKKGTPSALKSLDQTLYIRQFDSPQASSDSLSKHISQKHVRNLELLFPDWNVEGENWVEGLSSSTIKFPTSWEISEFKSVKEYLKLEDDASVDPKLKNKKDKDAKKGKTASVEFEDREIDENGKMLPRIFCSTDKCLSSDYFSVSKFSNSSPDGTMISIFQLIERFGPSIFKSGDGALDINQPKDYLWRLIYPQTNTGIPCYNPAGKYAVRLYIAGKWRKVSLDDVFPVSDKGVPLLASSENSFELWPSILSKALYIVFTALDLPVESLKEDPRISMSRLSIGISCLTGWLPSSPWSMMSLLQGDSFRLQEYFQNMLISGTPEISPDCVPESEKDIISNASSSANTYEFDASIVKMTKIQFKQDFQRRKDERDQQEARLLRREKCIENVNTELQKCYSHFSLFGYRHPNSGLFQVFPVLGLKTRRGGMKDDIKCENNEALSDWFTAENSFEILSEFEIMMINGSKEDVSSFDSSDPSSSHSSTTSWKVPLPPLPSSTPLKMSWKSFQELQSLNPLFLSMDTRYSTSFMAPLGWHWTPLNPLESSIPSKGSKDAKKTPPSNSVADSSLGSQSSVLCCDPGAMPTILLQLNENEIREKNDSMIELSIVLYADPTQMDSVEEPSSLKFGVIDDVSVILEEVFPDIQSLSSPVTGAPLLLRAELLKGSPAPWSRCSFRIPLMNHENNRDNHGSNRPPRLFWVRYFGSCSAFFTFHSNVSLRIGKAATIWSSLSRPVYCFKNDISHITPLERERLLFRLPLIPDKREMDLSLENDDRRVYVFFDVCEREIAQRLSLFLAPGPLLASSSEKEDSSSDLLTFPAFPRLSCICQLSSLKTLLSSNGSIPLLLGRLNTSSTWECPPFSWSLTVLSAVPLGSLVTLSSPTLLPLSIPIINPNALQFPSWSGHYIPNNAVKLFQDVWKVDISQNQPLAFQVSISSLPSASSNRDLLSKVWINVRILRKRDHMILLEGSGCQSVKFYMLTPLQIQGVSYPSLGEEPLPTYSPTSEGSSANLSTGNAKAASTATAAAAKGGGKKGAAATDANGLLGEGEDVIVIAELDRRRMMVPSNWKSPFPYDFESQLLPMERREASHWIFQWRVDILSGQVASVCHDTASTESWINLKNSWEESMEGRSERSKHARESYLEKQRLAAALSISNAKANANANANANENENNTPAVVVAPADSENNTKIISEKKYLSNRLEGTFLTEYSMALAKDSELLKPRLALLSKYPLYDEQLDDQDSRGVIPTELFEEFQHSLMDEVSKRSTECSSQQEKYNQWLQLSRTTVSDRVNHLIQTSFSCLESTCELWNERENYRKFVEMRNEALKALLKAGDDAIQAEIDKELEAEGGGDKKKKDAKKKK